MHATKSCACCLDCSLKQSVCNHLAARILVRECIPSRGLSAASRARAVHVRNEKMLRQHAVILNEAARVFFDMLKVFGFEQFRLVSKINAFQLKVLRSARARTTRGGKVEVARRGV